MENKETKFMEYNKLQDERIGKIEDILNGHLNAKTVLGILGSVIVIMLSFFGYIINSVDAIDERVEKNNSQFLRIEAQLSQIQTDLVWIQREISTK